MPTVLIGVDSTARSEDAIAFVRALAPATAAEIVVATAVQGPATPDSEAYREADATARRMRGLLAGVNPERTRTRVVESRSPAQGLHELAAEESAALVVVGSTHTGQLGRVRPGSTGERLLSGGPCAVAVAPYGYRTRRDIALRRIGVAYDGSAEAKVALDAGIAAARALRAPLQVITVIPSDVYGAPALMAGPGWVMAQPEIEHEIRKDLDDTVAAVPPDIAVEGVVLTGRPWRELESRSSELDLLFIGSRGYGPLHAVVLGGTNGPLMREAHCPVIALPRGADTPLTDLFGASARSAGFPQELRAVPRTFGEAQDGPMEAVTSHRSHKE